MFILDGWIRQFSKAQVDSHCCRASTQTTYCGMQPCFLEVNVILIFSLSKYHQLNLFLHSSLCALCHQVCVTFSSGCTEQTCVTTTASSFFSLPGFTGRLRSFYSRISTQKPGDKERTIKQ